MVIKINIFPHRLYLPAKKREIPFFYIGLSLELLMFVQNSQLWSNTKPVLATTDEKAKYRKYMTNSSIGQIKFLLCSSIKMKFFVFLF